MNTTTRRAVGAGMLLAATAGIIPELTPSPAGAAYVAAVAPVPPPPQLFDDSTPAPAPARPAQAPAALASGPSRSHVAAALPARPGDLSWSSHCDADPATPEPYCLEPTGSYQVSGTVSYGRRELVADFTTPHPKAPQYAYSELSNSEVVPAVEVLVRVADGCGLYWDTYTDSSGGYEVDFVSWCGEKTATVTAYAVTRPDPGRRVAVGVHTASPAPSTYADLDDDPGLYTVVSGEVVAFVPEDSAEAPQGLVANRTFYSHQSGPLATAGKFARPGEMARALTIVGNAQSALAYYRALVSADRLPPINVMLTSAALDDADNFPVYFHDKSRSIYLPPDTEWSYWALAHETGHYFDGGILVDGGLGNYGRWGEPMANIRAATIIGHPWMAARDGVAAENLDVQGNWSDDDGAVVLPGSLPASNTQGGPGQGWVWRILWDLHDGAGAAAPEPIDFGFGHFDGWDGGGGSSNPLHHLINGVVRDYLPQRDGSVHPDYVDRGQSGPDIVDMLDGFACLYGLDQLSFGVLLEDVLGYPYDFAHCNTVDDLQP